MSAVEYCGRYCATNTLEDGTYVAVPIRCRSWDCPSCAKANKRRLLRRLRHASPTLFATLTTSPLTAQTPQEAFARANDAVPKLFKRWQRMHPGDRFEYFLVWERTKAGWPHAHILLVAGRVAKRWLSQQWRELTGSYIVDLQPISSPEHAANYLTKYLTKDPQVPAGYRRWRRSKGFFQTHLEPPIFKLATTGTWKRTPLSARTQAFLWFNDGRAIVQKPDGMVEARGDPVLWLAQVGAGLREKLLNQLSSVERAFS